MTRRLLVVDANDSVGVARALRAALNADGPAIMPYLGTPRDVPEFVSQHTAVVIESSGSTGRPKRVELSADALLASAAASEAVLGVAGQWLLALPLSYIAGINVLVRSVAAGTEPVVAGGSLPAAMEQMTEPVRYTSLVPVQLARLMDDETAHDALRRFDRILVGGQASPPALLDRARELGIRVTRTYGSSETSGGCVYDGVPIGNTRMRIVDGRVQLAGSMLAEGYLDDPERTAAAFEHDGAERWYLTDDTGTLADGVLRVTGRIDDVIVSGGVKVSLAEVELAVRSIPGLADAVVVRAPHAQWGEVPVVFTAASADLETVRAAVGRSLGNASRPARIVTLAELPLLATGKPDRVELSHRATQ
ncbi:MAG: AMP-binding protein [Rhodoglobus sp.]